MVGYGPAVSEPVAVQELLEVLVEVLSDVLDELEEELPELFVQANGATMPSPKAARPFLKNAFLSILMVLVKSNVIYDTAHIHYWLPYCCLEGGNSGELGKCCGE
jgi:hypothetical protein